MATGRCGKECVRHGSCRALVGHGLDAHEVTAVESKVVDGKVLVLRKQIENMKLIDANVCKWVKKKLVTK